MNYDFMHSVAIEYEYTMANGGRKKAIYQETNIPLIVNIIPAVFITKNMVLKWNCNGIDCDIDVGNRSRYPIEVFIFDKIPCGLCYYQNSYRINGGYEYIQNAFDGYRLGIIEPCTKFEISYFLYNRYDYEFKPSNKIPPVKVMYRLNNAKGYNEGWRWYQSG